METPILAMSRNVHDVLAHLHMYLDRPIQIVGSASFLGVQVWLHDDLKRTDAIAGRILIAPTNRHMAQRMVPTFLGAIPQREMRAHYRLLTIAGTLRKSASPEFAATLEDVLWMEQHHSGQMGGIVSHPPFAVRQGIAIQHPLLQPGMSVKEVITKRESLLGSIVRISASAWAKTLESEAPLFILSAEQSDLGDPARCIILDDPDFCGLTVYWLARSSHANTRVGRAVNTIITGRLVQGDGINGALRLEQLTEACLTTMTEKFAPYRCFQWPLWGSGNVVPKYV